MARYVDPNTPPPTSMHIAKTLAGPGALFVVFGLVLVAIGVGDVLGLGIVAVGVLDLLAAAFFALKDPHVRATPDDE
jgi:hypothetical protein